MKKYLLKIEFRYDDAPGPSGSTYHEKTATIGVFDTLPEAIVHGNALLEQMEQRFAIHVFPNGGRAHERFSERGGCFGMPRLLVSNMAYLKTPFTFFAQIETLDLSPAMGVVDDVVAATNRHRAARVLKANDD